MFKKIAALATAAVLCAGLMAGCGASSTTADTSYSAENPLVLTLAHGLSETHTVHIAMTQFAEEVNEKTDGRIQVFSRYVLNSPVAFTEELVRYSLIWTGFIGAAYAFSTREHMSLTLVRDKFTGKAHTALLVAIDGLILLLAIFVITIGGFKLAVSASREFSALLGIPRSLVYSIAPISGIFIIIAQIINIYEDITGEKVDC